MTRPLVLRAAGGATVGVGHLVRTRAIAQECQRRGVEFEFLVDDRESAEWLRARGIPACAEAERSDWLHSDPSAVWLDGFRDWAEELDVLADGRATTLLVENREADRDRASFVVYPALHYAPDVWDLAHPDRVRAGADWIPLSREILETPENTRDVDLLVSFGGSDPGHLTERALASLAELRYAGRVAVVLGPRMGERREAIEQAFEGLDGPGVVDGRDGISGWQSRAHFALTALGTTLYELAWFGVPALILANYEGDRAALGWYAAHGPHLPLGVAAELAPEALTAGLEAGLQTLAERDAPEPLDLAGGSRRIVDLLTTELANA